MSKQIAPGEGISRHWEVAVAMRELLMDLRLYLAGKQTIESITPARLDELSRLLTTLNECREPTEIKY